MREKQIEDIEKVWAELEATRQLVLDMFGHLNDEDKLPFKDRVRDIEETVEGLTSP